MLGAGGALPTRVGAATLGVNEYSGKYGCIDAVGGFAYFGAAGSLAKVAVGAGSASPSRIGAVQFNAGEAFECAAIDTAGGYGYFGSMTTAGTIAKVALGSGNAPPTRVGALTLGNIQFSCAAIDAANGYGYFGAFFGVVYKVALGAGGAPPTVVGTVGLSAYGLRCALIDTAAGYVYFGTQDSPGKVVKVVMGAGSSAPAQIGILTLNSGEGSLFCGVIDPLQGYAYFGTTDSPGKVVKVALGASNSLPTHVAALALNSGENDLRSAVIDAAAGYAYFGTATAPGTVVKVALGTGSATPSRIGAVTCNSQEDDLFCATIDPVLGLGYFGTFRGYLVKIALGIGGAPPTRVESTSLNAGEEDMRSAVIDSANGYIYIGTESGNVVKVRAGNIQGVLKASRVVVPENATLVDVHLYSNVAKGNLRMGIYDNSSPRKLVWQSGSIPNVPNPPNAPSFPNEVVVPISAGTPAAVSLSSDIYWLAWQIDSSYSVPSYYPGVIGDGFYVSQAFGTFASTLGTETITDERWTEYITYFRKPNFVITGSGTQTAGASQTVTITANDVNNNVVAEYTGSHSLVFSGANSSINPVATPAANGTGFGSSTSITFTNGVATVPITLYKAEAATLSVFDSAYNASTITPLNVAVSAGTLDHFAFSGPVSPQNAGQSQALTITAQDLYGNTRTAYIATHSLIFSGANPSPVPVTAPTAGGSNFGTAVSVIFSNGAANIPAMTLYNAENALIDVTDGTIHAVPRLPITVNPLAISKFAVAGASTQTAGTSQIGTISAQDVYGNTATGYSGSQLLLFTGANVSPNGTIPAAGGVNFGGVVPLNFNLGQVQLPLALYKVEPAAIQVSSGTLTTPIPLSINVTAGSAASLQISGPASQIQGSSQNVIVKAFDAFGNTAVGYTGTVSFTSSDSLAMLPVPQTFTPASAGQKTLPVTLKSLGLQSITVSDGTLSALANISVTPSGGVAPTATDHAYTTNENGALTVIPPGLLEGSFDQNGLTLTPILVAGQAPQDGTLNLNADGSFNYTPNQFFNGVNFSFHSLES